MIEVSGASGVNQTRPRPKPVKRAFFPRAASFGGLLASFTNDNKSQQVSVGDKNSNNDKTNEN